MQAAEGIFIRRLTRAKQHKLHISAHHFIQNGCQNIHTLLVCQACNHGNQWNLSFLQAQALLQGILILCLPLGMRRAEMLHDKTICFGVICRKINAVQNPTKAIASAAQNAIHTIPIFGCLNFLCVGSADGADIIGIHQTHFHIADRIIKLHIGVCPVGYPQKLYGIKRKTSLILQIMNRKQCFDFGIFRYLIVHFLQIHTDRPCLPVVAIKHCQHIQNSLAEKGKAFVIVIKAV